jgi:hypothetical protein
MHGNKGLFSKFHQIMKISSGCKVLVGKNTTMLNHLPPDLFLQAAFVRSIDTNTMPLISATMEGLSLASPKGDKDIQ